MSLLQSPAIPAPASLLASEAFGPPSANGIISLSLPPEQSFPTEQAAIEFAQAHAKSAGYAFVQGSGQEKRKGRWRKFLKCKRAGVYDGRRGINEDSRERNRKTKKIQCGVSIKLQERPDGSWDLKYRSTIESRTHNHPPADASAFHEHRTFTPEQIATIVTNHQAGIPATRTSAILRAQDPKLLAKNRDFYNQIASFDRLRRRGKPPNEALVAELERDKAVNLIYFAYERDGQGHITRMFVADMR
jgi:hypothetical protein